MQLTFPIYLFIFSFKTWGVSNCGSQNIAISLLKYYYWKIVVSRGPLILILVDKFYIEIATNKQHRFCNHICEYKKISISDQMCKLAPFLHPWRREKKKPVNCRIFFSCIGNQALSVMLQEPSWLFRKEPIKNRSRRS